MADSYTIRAARAVLEAARAEHDFGGWLAGVLATAAAELGSTDALTAGRPGSWEAELVQRLAKGTVGWSDEYLADYKPAPDRRPPDGRGTGPIGDREREGRWQT